ncbi:MAG: aldo/keto reductase [Vulcanimicrobiaceae bacterium]
MHYNRLGSTGLFVSELALGTMTFGASGPFAAMGTVDQAGADAMVARAFDAGINLIDTADTYSLGAAETMLGRALENLGKARDEVVIATKVFGAMGERPNQQGSSRAHILAGARSSMERLGTDYIDLYQLHGFDPATPIEESLGALDDLVRRGHVRYVGVSNWAAWQIAKALGISAVRQIAKISSLEAYYSIVGRDLEREIVPMLASEDLGLLVWSPLAGGLLGGKISRDTPPAEGTRRGAMAFPPVELERAYDIIDVLEAIATEKHATVPQLAIAWLLHRPRVTSVVIGARRVEQLDDTLAAVSITFAPDELRELDRVSALAIEYPGWMIDLWSGARANQLAATRHANA